MHIHILGICGTFMAGIAVLAKQLGHHVTGSDANVYPPMSTQLTEAGITLMQGYEAAHLKPAPNIVIIGNAMKRGNAAVEYILAEGLPYISAPQWLAEQVLQKRWVLAVAGTHGKTTTSSILAWILHYAGLNPGFLIGGIPQNFSLSARLGDSPYFVIEADEYDSAFFDKRSKFIHYHPRTAILNNLEFDHADIFDNLAAIQRQFHYLVRTIPNNGLIVRPSADTNLDGVIEQGCWTPIVTIGHHQGEWRVKENAADYSNFTLYRQDELLGTVNWGMIGQHNMLNALTAVVAAHHVGIAPAIAIAALNEFQGVKRRLEIRGEIRGVTFYDDFAHHPTAIVTTLMGLRHKVGEKRIIAIVELGSFTMRTGVHRDTLAPALATADIVLIARPKQDWGVDAIAAQLGSKATVYDTTQAIVAAVAELVQTNDQLIVMSNTGFDGLHEKLLQRLSAIPAENL